MPRKMYAPPSGEPPGALKFVLCWGDLATGHEFIGPFDSAEAATGYAENDAQLRDATWCVILLQEPAP